MLIWEAVTLPPQMQWCVAWTRVIATLLFTYSQVREWGFSHSIVRRMAICLSVAFALTLGSSSTEATKGVKCQ